MNVSNPDCGGLPIKWNTNAYKCKGTPQRFSPPKALPNKTAVKKVQETKQNAAAKQIANKQPFDNKRKKKAARAEAGQKPDKTQDSDVMWYYHSIKLPRASDASEYPAPPSDRYAH